MNRIDRVRLKIERAKEHIRNLDNEIRVFNESKPYTLGAKEKPEISRTALYIYTADPIPNHFSLIIGDAVHNVRSALDHLAWQLVEAGGGQPGTETMFPICDTGKKYRSAIKGGKIEGVNPGAQKIIKAIQPYNTGDKILLQINCLDIIDKHRLVVTVGLAVEAWGVNSSSGQEIWFPQRNIRVPFVTGSELTNLDSATYKRERHEHFKLAIDVSFGEPKIVEGQPVLELLNGMADFANNLISNFEPFLI